MPKKVRKLPVSRSEPRYLRPEGNRRLRRRRRTRAAVRFVSWAFVWLAGAGALAGAAAGGWSFLTRADRFPLSEVIVEGGPEAVKAEIAASLRPFHGRNLLDLDLRELEHHVRAHAWVRSASIHRRLPDALLVLVNPRSVEALVEVGGRIRMFGGGQDLGPYEPRWGAEDQPVITGLGADTRVEVAGRLDRALDALSRLREEAPGFVEGLSTLDVSREDRLTVTLRDFAPAVYLNPADPVLNLHRLPAVRARVAAEGLDPLYLDLRFRDRIAVMPALDSGRGGARHAS